MKSEIVNNCLQNEMLPIGNKEKAASVKTCGFCRAATYKKGLAASGDGE